MYMYYRPSLFNRVWEVIEVFGTLILCLAIFMVGMSLENNRETETYANFQSFLEDVNAGRYDHREDLPNGVEIWSLEKCIDGNRYISGQIDAYSFRGYTSAKSPTAEMQWSFYAYPNSVNAAFWLQCLGFAGSVTWLGWFILRRIFKLPPFPKLLRSIWDDSDDY